MPATDPAWLTDLGSVASMWPEYLHGAWVTLQLLVTASAAGLAAALPLHRVLPVVSGV